MAKWKLELLNVSYGTGVGPSFIFKIYRSTDFWDVNENCKF